MPVEEQAPAAVETTPVFDQAAFIKARNEGKAPAPGEPAAAAPPAPAVAAPAGDIDPEDEHAPRLSRSQRRELNRLREEAAEARGRLAAYQELQARPAAAAAPAPATRNDTEPDRQAFDSDAAYLKALAKYEAVQLHRASQAEAAETTKWSDFRQQVATNTEKFHEDVKLFPDWAAAQEAIEDIIIDTDKQPTFVALLGQSDQRAAVTYYFAKHRAEFEAFLKLTPDQQFRAFHRLEGRVENSTGAAQASGTSGKTAPTAEKPAQGATAAERDLRKPRPSTEVAARGGSAPPDEPAIGSAAWMAKRNQAQYAK